MKAAFETIRQHLQKEFSHLQVGRASPALLDDIAVEAYGTTTALSQLASITNQGAQMLVIQPWDANIIKDVERALRTCGRDYNPAVDGAAIRLPFPSLTEEKRKDIVKLVSARCEEARVQVKRVREELMHTLKTKKNDKAISEDTFFAEQKAIQKMVDDYNAMIERLRQEKEADIMKL